MQITERYITVHLGKAGRRRAADEAEESHPDEEAVAGLAPVCCPALVELGTERSVSTAIETLEA